MIKVYNTNGSLNHIKRHLLKNNIQGLQSVLELQNFQRDYTTTRQQIVSNCRLPDRVCSYVGTELWPLNPVTTLPNRYPRHLEPRQQLRSAHPPREADTHDEKNHVESESVFALTFFLGSHNV